MVRHLFVALLAFGLGFGVAPQPSRAASSNEARPVVQQVQYYGPGYYGGPRYGYYGPRRFGPRFYGRHHYRRGYYGPRYYGRGYYGRRFYR